MAGGKLKFKKKTEKIVSLGSKNQGLAGSRVKLAGNKKKKTPEFKYLKQGKSSYPDENEDIFAKMARGDEEEEMSVFSESSSASSMNRQRAQMKPRKPRAQKREDFSDLESLSLSSGSSGRYSGSSLGSAGSVPVERSLNILRGQQQHNPWGLSDQELEEAEKQDILARLAAMRARGVKLSKNYTMRSSLKELQTEMGRIEHEQDTARSVQRLRRWLLAGVSGVQYATNTKYAPKFAKGKLNGFSDYVLGSITDFDPVFERMSERYSGVIGVGNSGNPLVDLLMLLGSQIVMFLFMQHQAGVKPPSEEEIRKQHPELIRNIARQMAEQMRQEEKHQEARIRQEELNRISQYQRQARQTFQEPEYQAPPQREIYQPVVQQTTNRTMPEPSFQLPLDFAPPQVVTEQVDQSAPDMYDVLTQNPDQQETVEGLHGQTVPTEDWVPSDLTAAGQSAPIQEYGAMQNYQNELPQYELPETFPVRESPAVKMVEMPVKGQSTRRGRPVKVNEIPKAPPAAEPQEEKKSIQIS